MSNNPRSGDWTKRIHFQPDLDYYPILLDKAQFVITPLSTMVIESSIMKKKVLILGGAGFIGLGIAKFIGMHRDYIITIADIFSPGQKDTDFEDIVTDFSAGLCQTEGDEVKVSGKVIEYAQITSTFWILSIIDDNGFIIEVLPGENSEGWLINESFE